MIYQQSVPLHGMTDSYSFFFTITQYKALREKRLSIGIAVVREVYAKFELANLGFVGSVPNLADPMITHVKNTHLDKLLDTGEVDHPVEEYVTRAQITHDSPFDEEDMPFVDVSIFFGSVCWDPKRIYVVYRPRELYTCHGILFCTVDKALSTYKLCPLCLDTRHGPTLSNRESVRFFDFVFTHTLGFKKNII
jgi:hypothetical protein